MMNFRKMHEYRRDQFDIVLAGVLNYYNKTHNEIIANTKIISLLEPRQMVAYLAYDMIDMITQDEIIDWLGYNHRSTISKGIKMMKNRLQVDKAFAAKVAKVKDSIENPVVEVEVNPSDQIKVGVRKIPRWDEVAKKWESVQY